MTCMIPNIIKKSKGKFILFGIILFYLFFYSVKAQENDNSTYLNSISVKTKDIWDYNSLINVDLEFRDNNNNLLNPLDINILFNNKNLSNYFVLKDTLKFSDGIYRIRIYNQAEVGGNYELKVIADNNEKIFKIYVLGAIDNNETNTNSNIVEENKNYNIIENNDYYTTEDSLLLIVYISIFTLVILTIIYLIYVLSKPIKRYR